MLEPTAWPTTHPLHGNGHRRACQYFQRSVPNRWFNCSLAIPLKSIALLLAAIFPLYGCGPTLVVGGAAAIKVVHDRRTPAAQLEDQTIEIKATHTFLQSSSELPNSHINVTSYNKTVLLSGEVGRPEIKQWAEQVVTSIDGVRRVHNELIVGNKSRWASRSNDVWITTKAKTSMLKLTDSATGFDPTRVKVVTERGVVYLFGLLTQAEGDAVTEIIRQIKGVQQVVKLFEYIEPVS